MYRIYYIKNNYTFRHLTLAIFRLRNEKNLVSNHTRRGAHLTSYLPTVYNPHKSSMAAYQVSSFLNLKMANEKCRKNVVVLYVINAIHISTII